MTKIQGTGSGYVGSSNGKPMSRNRGISAPPTGLIAGASAIWVGTTGVGLSGSDVTTWTDTVDSLVLTASGTPSQQAAPSGANGIMVDASDYLAATSTGSLPVGATPRTVIFVGRVVPDGTQWGGFTYGDNVNYKGFGISVSGQTNNVCAYFRGAVIEGGSVNNGNWFIATATYDGSSAALYLGKTLQGSTTVALNTGSARIRVFKSDTEANPPRNGTIGAVYVYPFALSPAQVAQMVDYLTPLWLDGAVVVAPTLSAVSFTANGQSSGDVSVSTDDSTGTIWYVLTTSSSTPTAAQVQNGLDASSNPAAASGTITGMNATGAQMRGVAGLSASTTYYPHAYQISGQSVASSVVTGSSDTTDAVAPPPTGTIDVVVFSASELQTTAQAWAADWAGTVPSGKTSSDSRVIGIGAAIPQDVTLTNLTFPQEVYIRTVGAFLSDMSTSCPITGFVNLSGSTKIHLDRLELRAPGGTLATGWINVNSTTDCTIDRCVMRGTPYPYQAQSYAVTARAMEFNGTITRLTLKDVVVRYVETALKWNSGSTVDMTIDGWFGEYSSGDDLGDISFGGFIDGITIRAYFGDRSRAKIPGRHCDSLQSFQSPARVTDVNMSYSVFLRGPWIDTGETTGVGWRFFIRSGASVAGASTVDNCLFANGHKSGHDKPNGNTMTATNNAYLFGSYTVFAFGNAPYPRPEGYDAWITGGTGTVTNSYQMIDTAGRSDVISTAGTGNIVRLTPGSWTSPDFTSVAGDLEAVPTENNFLWDIRPKAGGAMDPNGTACGSYDLWAKLYSGDPIVCKSVVGWPVAEMFIKWFDPGNNFAGGASGYTGAYDSDGNNA